jgi:hypothetical protein
MDVLVAGLETWSIDRLQPSKLRHRSGNGLAMPVLAAMTAWF